MTPSGPLGRQDCCVTAAVRVWSWVTGLLKVPQFGGLTSGVQMAVSPGRSLDVQEYSESVVERSQVTGLLQDWQLD